MKSWVRPIVGGACCCCLLLGGHARARQNQHADPDIGPESSADTPIGETSSDPDADFRDDDFADLSLEDLMEIEVISVTRSRGQSLFDSPAAIYVITEDEIRRSGHQSLPELLRLVPGVHVARIDANKWAISARGFNWRFNRFQLVQVDGRTVYTPVFSGVHWSTVDTVLEDIERIEVIRGPGASLWGANAVNGIINIVTRPAEHTQGALVTGGAGTNQNAFGTVRYGGKIGDDAYFRVYGKAREHAKSPAIGPEYTDDWRNIQGGFRLDFHPSDADLLTLQGDAYRVRAGESIELIDPPTARTLDLDGTHAFDGWNLLGRWNRAVSETSDLQIQLYYDVTQWEIPYPGVAFRQDLDQFDIDLQHTFALGDHHRIAWGLGYRYTDAVFTYGGIISADRRARSLHTFSGFAQDTVSLVPDALDLILGAKLEHNEFTHFEVQPGARLVWTPNDAHTVWGSVARAVRAPNLFENDGQLLLTPVAPGAAVQWVNNRDLKVEKLIAYELGYRVRPVDDVVIDLAAFINDYDDLRVLRPRGPLTLQSANLQDGESFGIELAVDWRPADNWRLVGTYSWLELQLHGEDEAIEHDSPEHQFSLRSYLDLTDDLELNAALYHDGHVANQSIDAFTRFDLGLTWHLSPAVDLTVWGQNLFDSQHPEIGPDQILSRGTTEVERGIHAQLTFRF